MSRSSDLTRTTRKLRDVLRRLPLKYYSGYRSSSTWPRVPSACHTYYVFLSHDLGVTPPVSESVQSWHGVINPQCCIPVQSDRHLLNQLQSDESSARRLLNQLQSFALILRADPPRLTHWTHWTSRWYLATSTETQPWFMTPLYPGTMYHRMSNPNCIFQGTGGSGLPEDQLGRSSFPQVV